MKRFLSSISRTLLRSLRPRPIVGFPGAVRAVPHFAAFDSARLENYTVYYDSHASPLDVLQVEQMVRRGTPVHVVAQNISDARARDFVLAGAGVTLIDFNTSPPSRIFKLVMDGLRVCSVLCNAGYGQVLDLRREERAARDKGGKGCVTSIYVLGNFGDPWCAKTKSDGNGGKVPLTCGHDRRDDIIEAGGKPVDQERIGRRCEGIGDPVLAFALGR